MSSILNSISSGDLQVQHVPEEKPIKEDSIIQLLKTSEIEFPDKLEKEPSKPEFEIIQKLEPPETEQIEIEHLLQQTETINESDNFNTGFGDDKDLHFDDKCKPKELKTPLYKENYLQEFSSEEDKASARHALGLYNKDDVIMLSLLTTEDALPNKTELQEASIKQLRLGDRFFAPATLTNAVYDTSGTTLDKHLKYINNLISEQQTSLNQIINVSNLKNITSLGDMKLFLDGFTNNENLFNIINEINTETLRFSDI
jgi:hypothetical protein